MGLKNTKEMFKKAINNKYSIGAFNANNLEQIQAIIESAVEMNSPVIIQFSMGAIKYIKKEYLKHFIISLSEYVKNQKNDIDFAIHLDHGNSFEICKEAIEIGFTSVMIDGSALSFEDNIALTKQVVEYAHKRNVTVEAELGKLAGVEDEVNVKEEDAIYTSPDDAVEFVERTKCDSLAIAIGTSHGAYKFKTEAKLRIDILQEIASRLPGFALVLHGASSIPEKIVNICNKYGGNIPGAKGVSEELLTLATKNGICKINIDSDLRLQTTASIRETLILTPEVFDPRVYLSKAKEETKEIIKYKMKNILGSSEKN